MEKIYLVIGRSVDYGRDTLYVVHEDIVHAFAEKSNAEAFEAELNESVEAYRECTDAEVDYDFDLAIAFNDKTEGKFDIWEEDLSFYTNELSVD